MAPQESVDHRIEADSRPSPKVETRRHRRLGVVLLGLALAIAGGSVVGVASATESAADVVHRMPLANGTPCTTTAKACVDLDAQRAWLLDAGQVIRGPVRISSGGAGKETPVGHSLRVYRKEKDYKSQESRLPNGDPAPMPWAVFFEDGGIAFHGGDPRRASAGCIRMPPGDARKFFEFLQIGDQVQVVRGKEERAARSDVAANLDQRTQAEDGAIGTPTAVDLPEDQGDRVVRKHG